MKRTVEELKTYYPKAGEARKIILRCACAAAAGGAIPLLSVPASLGAICAMYSGICAKLGIKLRGNLLRALAGVMIADLAADLAGSVLGKLIFKPTPGAKKVLAAVQNFITLDLAGLLFLKTLLAFARKGKLGEQLETVSASEFKQTMGAQHVHDNDVRAARAAYANNL